MVQDEPVVNCSYCEAGGCTKDILYRKIGDDLRDCGKTLFRHIVGSKSLKPLEKCIHFVFLLNIFFILLIHFFMINYILSTIIWVRS